ncbi:hypothetical protein [uncultured Clostridium sp.]|uniref:hypothetical protein n=1 Tax=uncultured Clostridium sp. TaxID=59620 RepID=UPI0026293B21|nr:hypothetical protein [uncultured Clostridium sp.]
MKKLSKEKYFEYNSDRLLGVMRIDFYDGRLANQWNPRQLIMDLNKKKKIDLKQLQKELNYIQFKLLCNFGEVIKICKGQGFEQETLTYLQMDIAKYVVKLIPVQDSYSYIYVYLN